MSGVAEMIAIYISLNFKCISTIHVYYYSCNRTSSCEVLSHPHCNACNLPMCIMMQKEKGKERKTSNKVAEGKKQAADIIFGTT